MSEQDSGGKSRRNLAIVGAVLLVAVIGGGALTGRATGDSEGGCGGAEEDGTGRHSAAVTGSYDVDVINAIGDAAAAEFFHQRDLALSSMTLIANNRAWCTEPRGEAQAFFECDWACRSNVAIGQALTRTALDIHGAYLSCEDRGMQQFNVNYGLTLPAIDFKRCTNKCIQAHDASSLIWFACPGAVAVEDYALCADGGASDSYAGDPVSSGSETTDPSCLDPSSGTTEGCPPDDSAGSGSGAYGD